MKRFWTSLAGLGLVLACYPFAKLPTFSSAEQAKLAARFRFQKLPLPELPNHPPYKSVRQVHPSLERICAWVSSLGAAATLADLDGDGLANDVIQVDPRTDLVTVSPVPGTGARYEPFALDTSCWAVGGYDPATIAPMGSVAGDFNEDGLIDILVYFWGRTPVLYLRKAEEASTVDTAREGPARPLDARLSNRCFHPVDLISSGERWYSNAAVQADLDGDGHADLIIGNYFQDGARVLDRHASGTQVMHEGKAKALNGGYKHLFLWRKATCGSEPNVQFQEMKGVLAPEVARGWTLAIGAADLDGDMLPELYIANDFGPDRLLHNDSTPGRLQLTVLEGKRDFLTPKSCVLGHDSFKSMGVDFGDVNGDGYFDIYVSNLATRFGLTESHFLWLSTGKVDEMKSGVAPYVHGSEKLGLARSGFAFDARLADFDNDGVLEAVQACGFIKGTINRWPELQALGTSNDQIIHNPRFWPTFRPGADLSGHDCDPFFVRGSDGRYHNVGPQLGLNQPMVSRGIAIADVDGDGRLDFITANQWGQSYVFRNQSPQVGAFLGLRLSHPNGSPAIGAVARLTLPDGRKFIGQVDGGNGHSGRRSPEIHFGLGTMANGTSVATELEWRDRQGKVQRQVVSLTPGWHSIRLDSRSPFVRELRASAPSAARQVEGALQNGH